jgi:hypothetical protein
MDDSSSAGRCLINVDHNGWTSGYWIRNNPNRHHGQCYPRTTSGELSFEDYQIRWISALYIEKAAARVVWDTMYDEGCLG